MLSAGVRGAAGSGHALAHLYPPPPLPPLPTAAAAGAMTPEFLPPPPRPYARYPPRAPRPAAPPAEPPSAAPAFPPVPGAYARFLPHPAAGPPAAGYATYPLYRPAAEAPQPPPQAPGFPQRLRAGSGFVPPAPRSPPAPAPATPPPPPPPPQPDRHFCRGALIRLESGALRRVEDMRTEDFVSSAERCTDLALTHCTLLRLEERGAQLSLTLAYDTQRDCREQVEMESTVEHPFFVYGQGWASRAPELTRARYGLLVRRLQVGDVCVSLVSRAAAASPPPPPHAAPPPPPQLQPENLSVREDAAARKRRWSAPDPHAPPYKKR